MASRVTDSAAKLDSNQQLTTIADTNMTTKSARKPKSTAKQEPSPKTISAVHANSTPKLTPRPKPEPKPTSSKSNPAETTSTPKPNPTTKPKSTMKRKSTPKPNSTTATNPAPQPNAPPKASAKPKPRKKSTPNPAAAKKWSLFPSLHPSVCTILAEENISFDFYDTDSPANCIDSYDTNIMGRFMCPNAACRAAWASKQIAITIRRYPNNRYNARVYHQRCKSCSNSVSNTTPAQPVVDDSYAERVAYRIKKWCGVRMEPPPFSGQARGPHRSDLCEGCRQGVCTRSRDRGVNTVVW